MWKRFMNDFLFLRNVEEPRNVYKHTFPNSNKRLHVYYSGVTSNKRLHMFITAVLQVTNVYICLLQLCYK